MIEPTGDSQAVSNPNADYTFRFAGQYRRERPRGILVLLAPLLFVLSATAVHAGDTIAFIYRDKTVVALDIDTGIQRWAWKRTAEPNFVQKGKDGFLVGCDDGTLTLLDPASGNMTWQTHLGGNSVGSGIRINEYLGTYEKGYLVADNNAHFWFVDFDGKVVWQQPPAKR